MATFAGHGSCLEIRLPGSGSEGESPSETLSFLPGQIVIFGAFPEARLTLNRVREAAFWGHDVE